MPDGQAWERCSSQWTGRRGLGLVWRHYFLNDGRTVLTYYPTRDKAIVAVNGYLADKAFSQAEMPPGDCN